MHRSLTVADPIGTVSRRRSSTDTNDFTASDQTKQSRRKAERVKEESITIRSKQQKRFESCCKRTFSDGGDVGIYQRHCFEDRDGVDESGAIRRLDAQQSLHQTLKRRRKRGADRNVAGVKSTVSGNSDRLKDMVTLKLVVT